jgi:fibronectin-binding autotransporter adhesin
MRENCARSSSRAVRRLAAGRSRIAVGRLASAAAILFAAQTGLAVSTSYTWYGNGSAAGGTGTWNATNTDWSLNGTSFVAWPSSGTTNVANFGGTGGVVTLTSNISVNTLNFTASGYSLAGSSKLTLDGTNPTINTGGFNVTLGIAANDLTLASGTTAIDKTGVGTLTITNSQSGTGGIPSNTTWNVSGGTLNTSTGVYSSAIALADGQMLGSSTDNVLDLNGGSLLLTASGGAGYASKRTIDVGSGGGTISDGGFAPGMGTSGGNTISPSINISAGNGLNLVANDILEFDAGNNGTGAGVIAGAGGINIYGTGTAEILSTNNTYQGGTTIMTGATLIIGGSTSLGAATGNLSVGGTLNLHSNSIKVGQLTSTGGTGVANNTTSAGDPLGDTLEFQIGSGTINTLTASSAVMSGSTGIQLDAASGSTLTPGTYTLISSTGGGLTGNVVFAGGQNLTVPANQAIEDIGGTNYRLTLADTGSAVTVTVAAAPAHTIALMPLGASITAGVSWQSPYNGGGYRSQLYENLVNDGRFTPQFVGSQTANEANSPTGTDLMTAVGQPDHEGHPGYTTGEILSNLTTTGGYLPQSGGPNPDYILVNVGGNDFINNASNTTAIITLGQIITQLATLRPNATIIVSSELYRGDGNGAWAGVPGGTTGFVNLFNPYIPALVYQAVLAGEHVSFLDLYNISTPNNSLANIGPDLVHPTQAGYDLMGNAWYSAMTTGQAFFTGNAGSTWAGTSGTTTSWAQDYQRTTDAGVVPSAGTDVYFNGAGGATMLGADFSVRSINFTAGATSPITIGGANTLTIGAGGITVQAGTAAHTISSAVNLGTAQTWSNVSNSLFTVSGTVGGSGALTIGGTGVIVLGGSNSYSGGITIDGGTLSLNNPNALAGGGSIEFTGGTLQFTGNNTNDYSTQIVNSTSSITIDTNGQNVTFAGVLASSNTAGLTKAGDGTLFLSNSGSGGEFSGGVILSAGTLNINGIDGLGVAPSSPAVAITFAGNSTLQLAAGFNAFTAFSVNRTISIPTAGVTGTIDTNGYSNMTAGDLITGNGTLGKAGLGTLTLTASNTYAGGTTISAGTLRANNSNGSATGTGNIIAVAASSGSYAGGMLGGSGSVSGSVTLAGSATAKLGGIIGAGAGGTTAGIGKLTTGNQTWNGGAAYQWKINAAGTATTLGNPATISGTAGTGYDTLQIGPNITNGSLLSVTTTGGLAAFTVEPLGTLTGLTPGTTYNWAIAQIGSGTAMQITINGTIINPSSSSTLSSSVFALDTSGLSINTNSQFSSSSNFSLYFETISGNNDLVLSYNATPEPTTALLVLSGTAPMLTARRRRRAADRKIDVEKMRHGTRLASEAAKWCGVLHTRSSR